MTPSFKKYCLFLLPGLFLSVTGYGQANMGYYRKGEELFRQKSFFEAAQYYEKFLVGGKDTRVHAQPFAIEKKTHGAAHSDPRQEAIYHLAECYRQTNDYIQAERRYQQTLSFPRTAYPESPYWYGVSLRANGKYAEAIAALTAFEKEYNDMGPVLIDADRELESLRFIRAQLAKNQDGFVLTLQPNDGYTSSYALSVQQGDTLVFTGIHLLDTGAKKSGPVYRNDLYMSTTPAARRLTPARLFPIPQEKDVNNGLASFSADGKKMFFTRWTVTPEGKRSSIWSSDRTDSGWSNPVALGALVNSEGYNNTQPFVTTDGKYLIFSSDRPGGLGKYDLWYANLDTGFHVLSVTNLGERINTPGDEQSPFYHQNSRTLVFASNGRVGMGGFDIYYSKGNFDLSRWEKPKNPGMPVNSTKDDLYFFSTDENNCWNTGWLSSDRQSGCCLALYSVQQDNRQYVSGTVVDCDAHRPLAGARFTVTDPRHKEKIFLTDLTDSLGKYHFELQHVSRFRILAEKEGYEPGAGNYLIHIETGKDSIHNEDLCLQPVPAPSLDAAIRDELKGLSHSSVLGHFPYKKSALPASAFNSLDSLVALMNRHPDIIIQIEGYTDGIGGEAYNIRLAQARVDACIRYLVKKGIAAARLRGRSFGKCCPLVPDTIDGKDNPAGREINRRVEYTLIR